MILGSNTFIPGFEEQLLGVVAGESRAVEATFPEAYVNRALAGQKANFDVKVKAVAAPEPFAIDDEFAKSLNFESLDKLKEMISGNLSNEYSRASREKLKRQLLDASTSAIRSNFPRASSRRNSPRSGDRSKRSRRRPAEVLRRRKHHRGSRARRLSPHRRDDGCVLACFWPKSAPRPT